MRDIIKLTLVLTCICLAAALALSQVYNLTKEPIAYQKRMETLRAVEAVLPHHDNQPDKDTVELITGKDLRGDPISTTFYRGRQKKLLQGVAFKVISWEGYGGRIEVMVGVSPEGNITGIEIIGHAETPGLGNKITDPEFKDKFKGRNLNNTRWKVKKDGGDIDQITGATISPRAVVGVVKEGLEFFALHREEIIK